MPTSLSAGNIVRKLLLESKAVTAITRKVFPIATDKAALPYVLYRRSALMHDPTKAGAPGADTVEVEVVAYAATYEQSVKLAEAVRTALDYARGSDGSLSLRSCTLADSAEGWEDDAFAQQLVFHLRI